MAISLEFRSRFFSLLDYSIKTQNKQLDGRERDEAAKFFFLVTIIFFGSLIVFFFVAIRQVKHPSYSLRVLRLQTTAFKILLCLVQLLSDN